MWTWANRRLEAHDLKRTAYLAKQGVRVLRFWNHDLLRDTDSVLEAIYTALTETLTPPLSQKRAREPRKAARRHFYFVDAPVGGRVEVRLRVCAETKYRLSESRITMAKEKKKKAVSL